MKKNKIISGVVAAAALGAVNASAQISYSNGDMLAGFRVTSGPSSLQDLDVIVDLGSISQFQSPGAPITFSIGSDLTGVYGSVSSVNWSVFGVNDLNNPPDNSSVTQTDPNTLWNTDAASSPTPHVSTSAVQLNVVEEIETIAGSSTSPSQGGPVTDLTSGSNFGAVEVVNGVTVSGNTTPTGYGYTPTIGPNGNFSDEWYDVENTGASTSDLYQSNPSSSPYGTPKATYLGNFVLDSSGDLTFNPAPEPSTWAMLGTGLVSLLAFNRYRRNK